jgi:hypothetical protein
VLASPGTGAAPGQSARARTGPLLYRQFLVDPAIEETALATRISIHQPAPSNVGEPQSVRDAWDKLLQAQAEAAAELGEIEIN